MITKEAFMTTYFERSDMNEEEIQDWHKHLLALPCHCDYEKCEGWQWVGKDKDSLKAWYDLDANKQERKDYKHLIK